MNARRESGTCKATTQESPNAQNRVKKQRSTKRKWSRLTCDYAKIIRVILLAEVAQTQGLFSQEIAINYLSSAGRSQLPSSMTMHQTLVKINHLTCAATVSIGYRHNGLRIRD